MKNYRVTFGHDLKSFEESRKCYSQIRTIRRLLANIGIDESWWFFEPYAEVTWLCEDDKLGEYSLDIVCTLVANFDPEYKAFRPSDGVFGEWYGLTPEERLFGAKRYAAIANVTDCYYDHQDVIDDGLGTIKQFTRATHCLANQLGLDYQQEGIALMKRGFLCLLFHGLGHEQAVTVYEKMFNEKYLGKDEDPS